MRQIGREVYCVRSSRILKWNDGAKKEVNLFTTLETTPEDTGRGDFEIAKKWDPVFQQGWHSEHSVKSGWSES